jgi:hypothetical protein
MIPYALSFYHSYLFIKGHRLLPSTVWGINSAVSAHYILFSPLLMFNVDDFFLGLMFVYVIDVVVRWFGLGWKAFRANGWNLFDIVAAGGSFVTTLIVRFGTDSFALDQLQKLFLVSIAFKLVQRNNSLNMLFKTSVYVHPLNFSLRIVF